MSKKRNVLDSLMHSIHFAKGSGLDAIVQFPLEDALRIKSLIQLQ